MKNFLFLALALPLFACGSKEVVATKTAPATPMQITSAEHTLVCGCKVDSIGMCGNYVEFDGEYAKITNSKEMGLGAMEWCAVDSAQGTVAGLRTGDKFVATQIDIAE